MSVYTIGFPKTRRAHGEPIMPAAGSLDLPAGYGYNLFKKVHPQAIDPNPQVGATSLALDRYLMHVEFELTAIIAEAPNHLCSGDTVIIESPSLSQARQHAGHLQDLAAARGLQINAHAIEYVPEVKHVQRAERIDRVEHAERAEHVEHRNNLAYRAAVAARTSEYYRNSSPEAVAASAAEYYKRNSPETVAANAAEYYKRNNPEAIAARAAEYTMSKYGIA